MKRFASSSSCLVADAAWNKTTRWSMRALAEMGEQQPPSSNAKRLLQDVALRLAGQHETCTRLMDHVSTRMTMLDNRETKPPQPKHDDDAPKQQQQKIIRAINQPVHMNFQRLLQQREESKQEYNKAYRQLHNLRVLHANTHQLTQDLLENDDLLERFNAADRHVVAATMEQIRSRHASTVETMADIVIELRRLPQAEDAAMMKQHFCPIVETFLQGRLGVQLLCDHYVALSRGKPNGGISVDCSLRDVLDDATTEAKHICDANLNTTPEVLVRDENEHRITLIRPWLHHTLVELLKNAMASSVQRAEENGNRCQSPAIHIHLRDETNHLCLDVLDQGVGLRSDENDDDDEMSSKMAFGFAQSSALKRWDRLDEQQSYAMVRSPLQSLGVGLPLSRMMMQWFGGDVTLQNRSSPLLGLDTGCTAVVKLHKDDTYPERLPCDVRPDNEDDFPDDFVTSLPF